MSASQEKRRRQEVRGGEMDKLTAEQTAQQRKKNLKRVRNIVIAVVVVLLIAAIFVINSNLFYTGMPAVTINGTQYTAAQVSYLYNANYISYVNTQGQYASMFGMDAADYLALTGLDTSVDLDKQAYPSDETMTWHDYFANQTLESLKQLTMLADEAAAAGFALSQEELDSIDTDLSSLSTYASLYGYSGADQYLAANYGKGVTVDTVREMSRLSSLANAYAQSVSESFEYSADELESYYQEHSNTYDMVNYRQFYISGAVSSDIETPTDEDTAAAMAAAKAQAEEMAGKITDEESFAEQALAYAGEDEKANYEEPDSTLYSTQGQNLSSTYSEWLLDAGRKANDVNVAESSSGYYVIQYVSREDNHYPMRVVRHILVKAVADESGVYTDEAKAEALTKAEDILAEWKSGDATEESFAALAETYSEDTGSNTNGGLYDTISKGATVAEFDAFCFDESRKSGDTAIVYGETSSYAGYHVMYYVGEGEQYSDALADAQLRSDDYSAWQTAKLEGYSSVTAFAFRFVG